MAVLSTSNNRRRQELKSDVVHLIDSLDSGDGVLVLVDSPGGTPANICLEAVHNRKGVEVVSGVNLPMMMSLVDRSQRLSIKELAVESVCAGRETIRNLTDDINARETADRSGSSRS